MSYIVNNKAEEVFNLLRKSMNTTNMDLQTLLRILEWS